MNYVIIGASYFAGILLMVRFGGRWFDPIYWFSPFFIAVGFLTMESASAVEAFTIFTLLVGGFCGVQFTKKRLLP